MTEPVATYSICACDLDAGQWGVATQSKFLAVGSVVPWAEPHVGAIATQSYANPRYGPDGLALLREGLSADAGRRPPDERSTTAVTSVSSASSTARATPRRSRGRALPRVGGRPSRARLRGPGKHPRLARDGRRPRHVVRGQRRQAPRRTPARLPRRRAARRWRPAWPAVGGPPRRRARRRLRRASPICSSTCASTTTPQPLAELRRLYQLHQTLFGKTPAGEWVPVDDVLRAEIAERLASLGHATLADWAGVENLEERVREEDRIDPVVLARLRQA